MTQQIQIELLFNTFPFLNQRDVESLLKIGKYKKFKNKEVIIQQGQFAPIIIFILKGTIRGYFIDNQGVEKNIFLKPELAFIAAPECLFDGMPTKYTFEAVQETHTLIFDALKFEELTTVHNHFSQLYIEALKENVQTLVFRIEMLAGMTPEERYEALLNRKPILFQTAFNKHIANYLGMTPNSLSRIIKRKKEAG